jgi:hypothetical protein
MGRELIKGRIWRLLLSGWRVWVLPLLVAFFGLILAAWVSVLMRYVEKRDIISRGQKAQAVVTSLDKKVVNKSDHPDSHNTEWTEYYLGYRFETPEGKAVEGSREVRGGLWLGWKVGQVLAIRYLPEEPQAMLTELEVAEFPGFWDLVPLTASMAISLGVIGMGVFSAWRRGRFLTRGKLVLADILRRDREQTGDMMQVSFQFHSQCGRMLTAQKRFYRPEFKEALVDRKLPILHKPNWPEKFIVFDALARSLVHLPDGVVPDVADGPEDLTDAADRRW